MHPLVPHDSSSCSNIKKLVPLPSTHAYNNLCKLAELNVQKKLVCYITVDLTVLIEDQIALVETENVLKTARPHGM